MRGDNAPAVVQPDPGLTLSPAANCSVCFPLKFNVNAAKVAAKGGYVNANDTPGKVGRRASGPKGYDLIDAVEIFSHAEPDCIRRCPEEPHQRGNVVGDEGVLVLWVESGQLGDRFGMVDKHLQKSSTPGSTDFASAPLTVIMGSLTTWLSRSLSATLQSR